MSGDIKNLLSNPIAIGIVAVVLLLLIIWLFMRSRRGSNRPNKATPSELMEMERENQFVMATEQMPYLKDVGETAREAASHFRDYLGWSVLAVYAGRERDERAANVLNLS